MSYYFINVTTEFNASVTSLMNKFTIPEFNNNKAMLQNILIDALSTNADDASDMGHDSITDLMHEYYPDFDMPYGEFIDDWLSDMHSIVYDVLSRMHDVTYFASYLQVLSVDTLTHNLPLSQSVELVRVVVTIAL